MTFKIKESFQIGTVTVVNSNGIIQDAALPVKVTAGTYTSLTVDQYGRVTAGSAGSSSDTFASVTGRGATTSVALSVTNTTDSTSTSTGAFVLTGGLGVGGAIWAGSVQGTPIGSTTRSTGAFTTLAANGSVTFTGGTTSTTSTTGQLVVTGGVGVSENLNVGGDFILGGNLTVNGTTTTINSTTQTVVDPILTLGGSTAPVSDDNKDRGIEFRWHNGSVAKKGFFGFDDSTGYFTFIPDATNTGEVFSGTLGDIEAGYFRGALIGNADTATKTATARSISITGDAAWTVNFDGSANATAGITFATVNSNVGTYNTFTVNGKGLITAASNTAYLTAEADTLATVTGRGSVTTTDIQVNNSSFALAPSTTAKIWIKSVAPTVISINTAVAVDSWAVATYRSAKYSVQVTQGTKYQISELTLIHDGTLVYSSEYAIVETNAGSPIPITYTASISSGTLTLNATLTDASTTNGTLLMERTLISV